MFESFEFLNRGWDIRILEGQSLRSVFLWLLPVIFLLGGETFVAIYQIFRLHRIDWAIVMSMLVLGLSAFRYTRLIYRRLGN